MKIALTVFFGFFSIAACFELEDPKQPGVEFAENTGSAQRIIVDEYNDGGRVNFVLVTGVQGELKATVFTGDDRLKVQIEDGPDSTQFYFSANLLDYEVLVAAGVAPNFLMDISENNDITTAKSITLNIKNIDDEPPTLQTSTCTMLEEHVIDVSNSTCKFNVSDPDGLLSKMDFTAIIGIRGESDLFEFKYQDPPADNVYEAQVSLVLKAGKTLDYETVTLYTFHVEAKDSAGHATIPLASIPIIVQVEDFPDQPPQWDSFQSALTITEKQPWTIQVSAKDGDYGINNPIIYDIDDTSGFIKINQTTGLIDIDPINRDAGHDQVRFIVWAIEEPDPESKISGQITLIVEDVDDNVALLSVAESGEKTLEIAVNENSDDVGVELFASDIDLGENAMYTITLVPDNLDFLKAFSIIPGAGYENTTLSLAVRDPKLLDFENSAWRTIKMTVVTEGNKNKDNTDSLPITINLNDVNDEFPTFDAQDNLYTADVREDVAAGTLIKVIKATDLDAEDIENGLKHEILGTLANSILIIEPLGGNITTSKEDAFDYEKQTEVIVQIRATDAADHTATAQLTIHVQDVNDENPRLSVSSTIEVEENQIQGFELTTSITASDEDTKPDLEFSIDWSNSYATKNSRPLDPAIFETIHCIQVKTIPGDTKNQVTAELSIIETQKDNTPDYEVFDTLYIQLVVTDKNTEKGKGTDSALVVISILDINDNLPIFIQGTETATRQVTENSANGTVVTSVTATDADIRDVVTYAIEPFDDNTPPWVAIDSNTGIVTVNLLEGAIIDCDDPVRYDLKYKVTASDTVHETPTTITIDIIDQNDIAPEMGNKEISINEMDQNDDTDDPNGNFVLKLDPTDGDRDAPWNVVACFFPVTISLDVTTRFSINNKNEIIIDLQSGYTLDREQIEKFTFDVDCYDDPTRQGQVSNHVSPYPSISITLLDVNDNYPGINNTEILGVVNENSKDQITPALEGFDADAGDNSLIIFNSITKIERRIYRDDPTPQADPPQDLIVVANGDQENQGILTINGDLRDFYGFLTLTISLTDKGTPPLRQDVEVVLEVLKYNFEEPKFIFPTGTDGIYLLTTQDANAGLKLINDQFLQNIQATDQQNGKFGITFKVVEDTSDGFFTVRNLADSQGQLQLTKIDPITQASGQSYTITITASIIADSNVQGTASFSKNVTVKVTFFDKDNTDPIFSEYEHTEPFEENVAGLTYDLPRAKYAVDGLPADLPIYYLLKEGDRTLFDMNITGGVVTLLKELDYETTKSYTLLIQSSNSETYKTNALPETQFVLTIDVVDVNDNPPIFDQKSYVTTLTVTATSRDSILQVTATDADEISQGKLRYEIASYDGSDPTIKDIPNPFEIDISSGSIRPNFTPKDTYKGFFTLKVIVRDEADTDDHMDTAEVKIYLVTADNIVRFTFENDQDTVRNSTDAIKTTLDANFASYNYVTRVEDPTAGTPVNENPRTVSQVFFLDTNSNAPIQATEIYKKVTDVKFFNQLRQDFAKDGLLLLSFDSETAPGQNLEETLKAWLIGVSVVLGALCLILLIAFILKTRALNQRINKLSNTKFGSQESGLNRTGVAAPTTNKHAVEGSNPVYNNDVDTEEIDRRGSVTSGDSDLIGVEDDDKFGYNEMKGAIID